MRFPTDMVDHHASQVEKVGEERDIHSLSTLGFKKLNSNFQTQSLRIVMISMQLP